MVFYKHFLIIVFRLHVALFSGLGLGLVLIWFWRFWSPVLVLLSGFGFLVFVFRIPYSRQHSDILSVACRSWPCMGLAWDSGILGFCVPNSVLLLLLVARRSSRTVGLVWTVWDSE